MDSKYRCSFSKPVCINATWRVNNRLQRTSITLTVLNDCERQASACIITKNALLQVCMQAMYIAMHPAARGDP